MDNLGLFGRVAKPPRWGTSLGTGYAGRVGIATQLRAHVSPLKPRHTYQGPCRAPRRQAPRYGPPARQEGSPMGRSWN